MQSASKHFKRLKSTEQAKYIESLLPSNGLLSEDRSYFLLIRSVLAIPYSLDNRTEEIRSALSHSINKLLACVNNGNLTSVSLVLETLNGVLRQNSWAVTQWQIDSLLSAISTQASINAPSTEQKDPKRIHSSLCKVMQSILTAHRPRINGRYHLVIDALNGLLRCLFRPYATKPSRTPIPQPKWLAAGASSSDDHPLDPSHAKAVGRLLSTLCDPAPNAVKVSRNARAGAGQDRQLLHDGIKKARALAGQHLQYFIVEFCALLLRGRLGPDMRAALNPGLYAVFNAMSDEVRRAANAALDEAGRAIFKSVYQDYVKLGKWEGGAVTA